MSEENNQPAPQPVQIVEQQKPPVEDRLAAFLSNEESDNGPVDSGEDSNTRRTAPDEEGSRERADGGDEPEQLGDNESSDSERADESEEHESNEGELTEEQEEALAYLTELAEEIDVDPADLYNLKVKLTTPEGEDEVSIGELKDFRQQAQDYVKERETFEQTANQFREWAQQQAHQVQAEAEAINAYTKQALQYLDADEKAAGLDEYAKVDPYQAARLKEQFDQRRKEIQQVRDQVAEHLTLRQQEQAQQVEQYRMARIQEETQKLHRAMNWDTQEKAASGAQQIGQYLVDQGFDQNFVDSIMDHRAFVLIDKARQFDEMQKKGTAESKKLVRTLNGKKLSKPGSRKGRGQLAAQQKQTTRAKLKKSGKVDDAVAAIQQIL